MAAIIVTPFKHDAFEDQELVEPTFARGARALADRLGAALVIDDVRAGFRIDLRGSWERYGVRPDLTAWSKAMANGYPIAAVTGTDALRGPAQTLYSTGSFWFSAVAMAAAKATIETLRDTDGIATMERAGTQLRDGLYAQAKAHGFTVNQTGPVTIPWLELRRRRRPVHGPVLERRLPAARGLPAPLAQLVHVGRPHGGGRGPRPGGHRPGLRRNPHPLRLIRPSRLSTSAEQSLCRALRPSCPTWLSLGGAAPLGEELSNAGDG